MKRRRRSKKSNLKKTKRLLARPALDSSEAASLYDEIEKLWDAVRKSDERLEDIEIHLNLLTRLITTLSVEKFGMRIGVLKRIIKRIESEAIRDSQILHLENLYKLPPRSDKKGPHSSGRSKNDPWDEIS